MTYWITMKQQVLFHSPGCQLAYMIVKSALLTQDHASKVLRHSLANFKVYLAVFLFISLELGLKCTRAICTIALPPIAGWSSLAARRAHNPKVVGSNPTPATNEIRNAAPILLLSRLSLITIVAFQIPSRDAAFHGNDSDYDPFARNSMSFLCTLPAWPAARTLRQ